jgi:hypothetical protein
MTTITINQEVEGLSKTEYSTVEELFKALKKIAPLKFYQADTEEFSDETLKNIEISKNNPNRRLTNFQG